MPARHSTPFPPPTNKKPFFQPRRTFQRSLLSLPLLPLQLHFPETEHHLPTPASAPRMAIYEDEPSSLVAFTLSSREYFDFLRQRACENAGEVAGAAVPKKAPDRFELAAPAVEASNEPQTMQFPQASDSNNDDGHGAGGGSQAGAGNSSKRGNGGRSTRVAAAVAAVTRNGNSNKNNNNNNNSGNSEDAKRGSNKTAKSATAAQTTTAPAASATAAASATPGQKAAQKLATAACNIAPPLNLPSPSSTPSTSATRTGLDQSTGGSTTGVSPSAAKTATAPSSGTSTTVLSPSLAVRGKRTSTSSLSGRMLQRSTSARDMLQTSSGSELLQDAAAVRVIGKRWRKKGKGQASVGRDASGRRTQG